METVIKRLRELQDEGYRDFSLRLLPGMPKEKLIGVRIPRIPRWPESEHPYTVRFGIKMLQDHFLDEEFKEEYLTVVAGIRREEYYIRMMIARYFSTAPAKQYDAAIRIFEERKLETRTHNKGIQKARESRRIPEERKEYLKSLRV